MDGEFWLERWAENQLGWHQADVNPHLRRHWGDLKIGSGSVLVPLCGKSLDLHWLAAQERQVIGVELAERAVQDFFAEANIEPQVAKQGDLTAYRHDSLTLLQGDFFALTARDVEGVAAVFDRAAMIALPPTMRRRYVQHLLALLPAGVRMLLVSLEYEQSRVGGPPHSVQREEIETLYGAHRVRWLGAKPALALPPKFAEVGIEQALETIYEVTI